jgi:hypothetical protein
VKDKTKITLTFSDADGTGTEFSLLIITPTNSDLKIPEHIKRSTKSLFV